ncbi:MAG: retropepsin-like aspartic protease, partial [Planctomycetota bacterium]
RRGTGQPDRTRQAPSTTPAEEERKPTERKPAQSHQLWVKGEGRPVALLHVAAATPTPNPLFCLPLSLVPRRRGPLTTTDGEQLDAQVIAVAWQRGLVLLQLPASAGTSTIPLPVRAAATLTMGERLRARDISLHTDLTVSLAAPLGGATELKLGGVVATGAVLLSDGHAVGYAIGGARALPLDPLLPWLRRPVVASQMSFADLQSQLRKRDPRLILEDAAALLAKRTPTLKQIREALAMLEQGQYLARDPSVTESFNHLLRQAHHQQVRVQSHIDPVQALVLARRALLRFPEHAAILADAVLLAVKRDPAGAASLYEQLLRVSPDHALDVADDVAAGILKAARNRHLGRRNQEALVLLARAVLLFPQRADMHLAYARALAVAGRDYDALAEASTAARLDPSYSRHVGRYQRAANQGGGAKTYVIPYDPRTRAIQAKATVGGQAVKFLVDTGASLTTIPTAVADRLGLRKKSNPRVKVTTASGEVEVEIVVLPSLRLGPRIHLRKVRAAVLDLPGKDLAGTGLLGLNVLQRLDMQIDSENSQLILKQPRKRR